MILDVFQAMFTFHFSLTQNWFHLRSIFLSTAAPNTIRHHLPARLLTFRLLVKFFWLVFTGTVNLCSVSNGICFHHFWTHKPYARFEQYLVRICWGFGLTIIRLLFLTFLSVPRGSHWYLKARPIPPPSTFLKTHQFWWHSFPCVRYMCSNVIEIRHSAQLFGSYPITCFDPMRPKPFHDLSVFR